MIFSWTYTDLKMIVMYILNMYTLFVLIISQKSSVKTVSNMIVHIHKEDFVFWY